jgi:NIPSNAP
MPAGNLSFRACTRQHSHNRQVTRVIEIRAYKLKPGSGAAFHRTVVEESLPMLARWGIEVLAFGPSLDDEDSYVLIRAYPSLEERQRSQNAFYGSDEWRNGPRDAIVSRIVSDFSVVLPESALSHRAEKASG